MKNSHFHCLQSSKIEESLTCELQSMRDQVNHKKTSMTEHVTHLETLRFAQLESFASSPLLSHRDEITIMTERKLDLERRIEALYSERDGLSTTLDESADRIVMLEKEGREQDSMVEFPIIFFVLIEFKYQSHPPFHPPQNAPIQIRNSKKEINELKATNSALTDRLDSIYRRWECQRN